MDDLPDEPITGELVKSEVRSLKAPDRDIQRERLQKAEERILSGSMGIVDIAMRAADIDSDTAQVPDGWVEEYGSEWAAKRALRIAQDNRRKKSERPGYLDMAQAVMVGIVKARSSQPTGDTNLKVQILLAAPRKAYAVLDLEPTEE